MKKRVRDGTRANSPCVSRINTTHASIGGRTFHREVEKRGGGEQTRLSDEFKFVIPKLESLFQTFKGKFYRIRVWQHRGFVLLFTIRIDVSCKLYCNYVFLQYLNLLVTIERKDYVFRFILFYVHFVRFVTLSLRNSISNTVYWLLKNMIKCF